MFKTIKLLSVSLLVMLAFTNTTAGSKIKFGKIDKAYLEATQCPIDSNAHAYFIFDKGSTDFQWVNGFRLDYKRHLRIKILDETALAHGTFEIPLYNGKQGRDETINNIKAITYNLENGKVVVTKMSKKEIIWDPVSTNWTHIKFALPNIKSGSVIEVTYGITSDYWSNLNGWYFQHKIPVLKSSYRVEIPEFYIYKQFPNGYLKYKTVRSQGTKSIDFGENSVDYTTEIFEYSIENAPAFPVGVHLTSIDNYISHVDFELASVDIPGQVRENYTVEWSDINKILLESENFGSRLNHTRCFSEYSEFLTSKTTNEIALMEAAFSFIKGKTKWNRSKSIWTSQTFKKTLETGIGNSADINLALVGLLRELGLEASPLVLSTRSNGFINTFRPSIEKLNYIIAICTIEGKNYLMDATSYWSNVNILPERCLNGKGLIVNKYKTKWAPLRCGAEYKTIDTYSLKLDENGTFSGYWINRYYDYASYLERNSAKSFESLDKYVEDLEEDHSGLTIKDFTISNVDSVHKNIEGKLEVKIEQKVEKMGDLLIFTPTFYNGIFSNPLKLETRLYPVEYSYPVNKTVKSIIQIPQGYEIESLPQGLTYKSKHGTCVFKYVIMADANNISLVSHYKRNQTLFAYDQYDELKLFYETIAKKHNEKIVLKKIDQVQASANTTAINND